MSKIAEILKGIDEDEIQSDDGYWQTSTGVYFADIAKVAEAFEIPYFKVTNNQELDTYMSSVMHRDHPVIVEFMSQHELDVQPAQAMKPDGKQGGLHEMSPFLSQEELNQEMIVEIK